MIEKVALVVDDHPITHMACAPILKEAGFGAILKAPTAEEAYRLAATNAPGLIILDLRLPDSNGLALIPRFLARMPEARILVFTMHDSPVYAARSIEAGALGYVTKTASPDCLLSAINAISRGEVYIEHSVATKLALQRSGRRESDRLASLSARELQVLSLIGEGRKHADIAETLGVSYKTIANVSTSLKTKLGVTNITELMRIALDQEGM